MEVLEIVVCGVHEVILRDNMCSGCFFYFFVYLPNMARR
jgi:hypothetical protein